jgi:hypothetical protein
VAFPRAGDERRDSSTQDAAPSLYAGRNPMRMPVARACLPGGVRLKAPSNSLGATQRNAGMSENCRMLGTEHREGTFHCLILDGIGDVDDQESRGRRN